MIALLAGMVIFPIVFQFGLEPTDGPGLIFLTLPLAFNEITGGYLFSGLFFRRYCSKSQKYEKETGE